MCRPSPGSSDDGSVWRRRSRAELARLDDGAARELGSGDAGGEAEVVLDPARRAGLPAQGAALDDERLEPLRRAVHGGAQARGPAADHHEVDLFPAREHPSDPERARHLADRGRSQLGATGQAHDRRRAVRRLVAPVERQAVAAREVEHPHRGGGRARADDLESESLDRLQRFSPGDERGQDEVAQRPVLEQPLAHHVAVDGDVAQRLGDHRRDEHGLAGEEVQLAEEAGRTVADDLVARRVEDRDLAFEDRDERVALGADAVQHVADVRRALLAELGQRREL